MSSTAQPALPLEWRPALGRTPAPELPPRSSSGQLHRWVGQVCAAIAEVASGDRGARQLMRVMAPSTAAVLQRRARLSPTGNAPIRRVLSVRISRPSDQTIEASAVVQGSRRCQAVAIQLRRRRDSWIVTAAEVR